MGNKTIRDGDLSFQSFIRPLVDLNSAAAENTYSDISFLSARVRPNRGEPRACVTTGGAEGRELTRWVLSP